MADTSDLVTARLSTLESDPIRNFRFLVTFIPIGVGTLTAANFSEIPGAGVGADTGSSFKYRVGFTSVQGFGISTDAIPYREGGYNSTVHQIPGQSMFSPIVMQRGVVIGSSQHWKWMKKLFSVVNGTEPGNFRMNIDVTVLDHPGNALNGDSAGIYRAASTKRVLNFRIYNAWISSLAYSDLNASDNALMIEQMTFVHEGFDMRWETQANESYTTDDYGGKQNKLNWDA